MNVVPKCVGSLTSVEIEIENQPCVNSLCSKKTNICCGILRSSVGSGRKVAIYENTEMNIRH